VLDATLGETQQALDAVASSTLGVKGLSLLCCGNASCLKPTIAELKSFMSDLESLSTLVTQAQTLLDCKASISPMFQSTLNEGTCNLSMRATAWTLGTLLIVSVFGMAMFTLRSALFTLKNKTPSDDDYDLELYKQKKVSKQTRPTDFDDEEDEHPVMTKRSWVEMQKSREISMLPKETYINHLDDPEPFNPYKDVRQGSRSKQPRSWETIMSDLDSRESQSDAAPPILKPLS
jgi:hypothetical protein